MSNTGIEKCFNNLIDEFKRERFLRAIYDNGLDSLENDLNLRKQMFEKLTEDQGAEISYEELTRMSGRLEVLNDILNNISFIKEKIKNQLNNFDD